MEKLGAPGNSSAHFRPEFFEIALTNIIIFHSLNEQEAFRPLVDNPVASGWDKTAGATNLHLELDKPARALAGEGGFTIPQFWPRVL